MAKYAFASPVTVFATIGQQNPQAWAAALGKADVEINPRYGTWSAQQNTWVVTPGGSLSVSEAAAAQAGQQQPQTGQQGG